MERGLKERHELFCREFVKTGSGSAAYRKSYSVDNMKDATVNNNAYKLLHDNDIKTRIKFLQGITSEVAEKKFKIDSEEILRHLDILRSSSINEYIEFVDVETVIGFDEVEMEDIKAVHQELRFKTFDKLTKEQLMCIESIRNTRNGIELKLHGKDWSIEKISKHIGFYEKDNTQKAPTIKYENVSKQFPKGE